MNSALVLSGGGALGMAHVGAVQALIDHGYSFDWYAGVSAGAIIAAGLAIGLSPKALKDLIEDSKLLALVFDFSWTSGGLLHGKKIRTTLLRIFEERTFADLDVPLTVGATDFDTGERLNIRSGMLVDAVQASLTVPILLQPYFHPSLERHCVDGGLSHNFPLDIASNEYGGNSIIGIDVNTSLVAYSAKKRHTMMDTMQRTFKIFFRNQPLPDDARIRIIRPDLADVTSFDIFRLKTMYKRGLEAGERFEKWGNG